MSDAQQKENTPAAFYQRVTEVLAEALDLETGERDLYLERVCVDDERLRAEVESLLSKDDTMDTGFLEVPALLEIAASSATATLGREIPPPRVVNEPAAPKQIGPYQIVDTLGEGGMGIVYLAEQKSPVHRQVALKVLEARLGHHRRLRFKAECQALARLSHPNIAAMYEAGSTEQGQLYAAMEVIEGTTITKWCDERRLGINDRIELFRGVCAGVQHAHQKGILHRDLKPSNVMVTEVDGQALAKVIDFGIARAFDEPLVSSTQLTRNQLIGSPSYMSPEAASLAGSSELDVRSDVYSLGVLLHELLTGVLPFEEKQLSKLLWRIAEEERTAPSHRFLRLEEQQRSKLAARRRLDEATVVKHLRGDLDAIVLKAIARDRERRYESPAELSADLDRHLRQVPVVARAPAIVYVWGRFMRRHFWAVMAGGLLVLSVIAGLVAQTLEGAVTALSLLILSLTAGMVLRTFELRRAGREAQRAKEALAEAQEVSRFLIDLFSLADPEQVPDRSPGRAVTVRELLDHAAEKVRGELDRLPLAKARFMHTLAEIYTKLGLFQYAAELISSVLEIRKAELPEKHPDMIRAYNQLGVIYRRQGEYDKAEPLLRKVLEAQESAPERSHVDLANAINNLGNLMWSQGRYEEAEQYHLRALKYREEHLGPEHADVGWSLNNLGAVYKAQRRDAEAETILRLALEFFESVLGPDHAAVAASCLNLSHVLLNQGKWDESEELGRRTVAIWKEAYGPVHPRTLQGIEQLAESLMRMGRYEESADLLRKVLKNQANALGADDPKTIETMVRLGRVLALLGELEEARMVLRKVLTHQTEAFGEEDERVLETRGRLAWLEGQQGRLAEAERLHTELLETQREVLGPQHASVATTLHHLAQLLVRQDRLDLAQELLQEALAIREGACGERHPDVATTLYELGQLAQQKGWKGEARQWLARTIDIRRQVLPPGHPDRLATERSLEALIPQESALPSL